MQNSKNNQAEPKEPTQELQNNIYNDENLIVGQVEEQPTREFQEWFKVKIQGVVTSYKIHDDNSLQLKFQEVIQKNIGSVSYDDYEDKSIRIRQENQTFKDKDIKSIIGKTVEIIDITETPQYKKISEGQYDFTKIENYFYSANNLKVINTKVENGYQLFKIFELKVLNAIPSISYDKRKRAQVIDKDKSVLIYQVSNDTLSTTHKIIVEKLPLTTAITLKGKDIVVLDLKIIGKNQICSKIKLK